MKFWVLRREGEYKVVSVDINKHPLAFFEDWYIGSGPFDTRERAKEETYLEDYSEDEIDEFQYRVCD